MAMPLQVEAVYKNDVLRPLQPLDLMEHERVVVSIVQTVASGRSGFAIEYIERIKREQQDTEPAPGIEEARRRLAKIPGPWPLRSSPTAEIDLPQSLNLWSVHFSRSA